MQHGVVYYSETGNTEKIAREIASELGCEAENLAAGIPRSERVEVLFLGAARYATHDHDINPVVATYVANLDPRSVGSVALFSTGFQSGALAAMRRRLESRGIPVRDESFFCAGKLFIVFNFGHPNRRDAEAARAFARAFK